LMVRAGVAELVPLGPRLRVIAVGRDLHRRPRAVFVVPADGAHQFLLVAIPPKRELVLLDRMHAKLGFLAGSHPLRPGIAEQAIAQQAEVIGPARAPVGRISNPSEDFAPLAPFGRIGNPSYGIAVTDVDLDPL